jgi:transcriptional regulator with XRE-family HTH domain
MSLRELRERRDLTLEAIAVLTDLDPATVSRLERGLVEPRRETIVKLARGLGISARRMQEILAQSMTEGEVEGAHTPRSSMARRLSVAGTEERLR